MYDEVMTGLIEAVVMERNKNKEESLTKTYNSIRDELSLHINEKVRKQIEELWYHITEADLHYYADNTIPLEWHDLEVFNHLLDNLNENDDVDHVYHNVNLE